MELRMCKYTDNSWTVSKMRHTKSVFQWLSNVSSMSQEDREYFPIDVDRFNWQKFAPKYAIGLRKYIAKEPMDNLDRAKRKLEKLRIAHYCVLVIYYSLLAIFYFYLFKLCGINAYAQRVYGTMISA